MSGCFCLVVFTGMGEGHVIGHFEMSLFEMEKVILATSVKTEERKKGRGEAMVDAVRVTLSLEASAVTSAIVPTTGAGTAPTVITTAPVVGQKPSMLGSLTGANLAPVLGADKTITTASATAGTVSPVASVALRTLTVVNCYVSPAGPEPASSSSTTNPTSRKGSVSEGVDSGGDKTKGKGPEANQTTGSTVSNCLTHTVSRTLICPPFHIHVHSNPPVHTQFTQILTFPLSPSLCCSVLLLLLLLLLARFSPDLRKGKG